MPKRSPGRDSRPRLSRQSVLTILSPEFGACAFAHLNRTPSSAAWHAANDPIAFPFRLSEGATVDQLCTCNGTAAGGNFDIGIYNAAWARLVSTGSTAGSGNSVWQFVDVTNTPLAANTLYYLVLVRDNITANRQRSSGAGGQAVAFALAGVQDSTTDAFPLPDPLTNMAAASGSYTALPLAGMVLGGLF